jgi:putative tricarboxylic transport membrane protein
MRLDDRIIALALGLLALATIALAQEIPAVPGTTFGPDLFPVLIGIGLAAMALQIGIKRLRLPAGGPLVDVSDWHGRAKGLVAAVWAIGGVVVGILFFNALGFPLFGFFFALPLMLLMGARPAIATVVALVVVVGTFLFFTRALLVPLPVGPLTFLS